jgi:hypothetical protein
VVVGVERLFIESILDGEEKIVSFVRMDGLFPLCRSTTLCYLCIEKVCHYYLWIIVWLNGRDEA